MFSSEQKIKHVFARIKLSDGRQLDGKFIISETSDLLRTLNGDGKFAVFVDHEGNHKLIAKSSIVEANEKNIKPVKPLSPTNDNGFNPYAILGVDPQTSPYIVRQQYEALARKYHPSRYTHAEMPAEIAQYATEMSKHIKLAYESLTKDENDVAVSA